MIAKFARLEFELFTRPSKSDFLLVYQPSEVEKITMAQKTIQEKLQRIEEKTKARIKAGSDPAFARWQGAVESVLSTIEPYLVAGQIVTSDALEKEDAESFQKLHTILDLAPYVTAVFLPRETSRRTIPPKAAESIRRVPEDGISSKVLVSKHNDFRRLMVVELGGPPVRTGIDIFQDGNLLGSYDYETPGDCMDALSKVIWVHLKSRVKWSAADTALYTENWFLRSAAGKIIDLPVNQDHSYIHHPVLLNISEVEAIFKLMRATLASLLHDFDQAAEAACSTLRFENPETDPVEITRQGIMQGITGQVEALHDFIVNSLLELLKLLRGYDIIKFENFSEKDNTAFKDAFEKTVVETYRRLVDQIR